ncbi:MAG: glutathione S-transferase family protein [Gammaproteobacteria bacterium]|nr:glutathione S-transferase family protein [Gammaproteobacteria bacterium]
MSDLKLLGLRVSVYTRIVRLALAEKNIPYQFDEVDIFADSGPPADYLALNPFGTIPSLRHGEFVLYETAAINRYLDEVFPPVLLQPSVPAVRARMNQILGVLDNYGYRPMVWDVYVQRSVVPAGGGEADEDLIAAALPGLRQVLQQLDEWRAEQRFLAGDTITLADLHAYPMLHYFIETPEGVEMLDSFPRLQQWFQEMQARDSVRTTAFHDNG